MGTPPNVTVTLTAEDRGVSQAISALTRLFTESQYPALGMVLMRTGKGAHEFAVAPVPYGSLLCGCLFTNLRTCCSIEVSLCFCPDAFGDKFA